MADTKNQKKSGVRGKMTAQRYFKAHKLTTHHAYARKAFNY